MDENRTTRIFTKTKEIQNGMEQNEQADLPEQTV